MKKPHFVTILLLLVLVSNSSASRASFENNIMLTTNNHSTIFSSSLTSKFSIQVLNIESTTVTCESTYGFLPCTSGLWGQLFLVVVYEYLLSLAQHYVSSGSDMFFKEFGSGILGASVFQILGTIPPVVILLVNGITGTTATAESLTSMGLAMLAGSIVMSLTLTWGAIVAFGSYDISTSTSDDSSTPLIAASTTTTTSSFTLTGSGITTDEKTAQTARIMLMSMIPFLILQLPGILDSTSATRIVVLVAVVVSIIFWLSYCVFQVFQPWIQDRRLEYIMLKFVRERLLECLLDPYGNPNGSKIKGLFSSIKEKNSGTVSKAKLEALFLGIQLKEVGLGATDYATMMMEQFDVSHDGIVTETKFVEGMKNWLQQAKNSPNGHFKENNSTSMSRSRSNNSTRTSTYKTYLKAAYLIVLGTSMSVVLAKPLMTSIRSFSTAINIPSFIITYIVVPLATCLRPAIASIKSAQKKTKNAISLTLSAAYGGVFMRGMMSLTMFLLIYYIRGLTWDVSAGMLVVLIVGLVMGILTSFNTKFPVWISIFAFLLYPISIGAIYILITYAGWS